jgi:hypothetical protein
MQLGHTPGWRLEESGKGEVLLARSWARIPADIDTHKVPICVPLMKMALRGANIEELGFRQWRTGENDGIL